MLLTRRSRLLATALIALLLAVLAPGMAHAAPPSNDDFDSSTPITALPFTAQQDTSASTKTTDDPFWCGYGHVASSVWFHYTATEDGLLRATTVGSNHATILSAYTGVRRDLRDVDNGCDYGDYPTITFRVTAGTTYHFMVSGYDIAGGALSFALNTVPPAANDNFADAEPVSTLPLTRQPDLSIASPESDEPVSTCGSGTTTPSVWYAYTTPGPAISVIARIEGSGSNVAVYTGNTLPELRQVSCASNSYYSPAVFRANPGTTYYVRVTGPDDRHQPPITLTLAEAPPLNPSVYRSPSDPTVYDTVSFSVESWNSIDKPMTTEWDFGDGTTAPPTTEPVTHRYTTDSTYPVTLRAKSPDGRTSTKTIQVKVTTHDVGITKFEVPATAREGQTKSIKVHVANTRYLEKPTVTLYKSNGSSWTEVGALTLEVLAHPTRKVVFPFAYTFTPEDAVVGKVTFRADVKLAHPLRDARPMDNGVIAIATTVNPRANGMS